jgi:hypothetical protein
MGNMTQGCELSVISISLNNLFILQSDKDIATGGLNLIQIHLLVKSKQLDKWMTLDFIILFIDVDILIYLFILSDLNEFISIWVVLFGNNTELALVE